jgi:hypothetical protein
MSGVTAAASLSRLVGIAADVPTPACVVIDDYTAPGPVAKRGLLLRGEGVASYAGSTARLALDLHRETTWDGVETHTADATT